MHKGYHASLVYVTYQIPVDDRKEGGILPVSGVFLGGVVSALCDELVRVNVSSESHFGSDTVVRGGRVG